MISLTSQLGFVALVFAAGTWYWSDVPWSHFFAAFLGVAVFAARFAPARSSLVSAGLAGALLALLAATRSFELLALVLAWGIAGVGSQRCGSSTRPWNARRVLVGAAAFAVTTAAVYLATGKRDLFFLYGNHLDRQSGDVLGAEIAETPTLSLATVPAKLVQLFVDPCFYSVCPISDYKTGGGDGSNLDLWSLPLAVQLPALVFLPLCVVGVGALLVRRAATSDELGGAHARVAPTGRDDDRVLRPRRRVRRQHAVRVATPALRVRTRLPARRSSRHDRRRFACGARTLARC